MSTNSRDITLGARLDLQDKQIKKHNDEIFLLLKRSPGTGGGGTTTVVQSPFTQEVISSVTNTTNNITVYGIDVILAGADPTGVADSTSAINAAISTLNALSPYGMLYFPPGTYKVTGALAVITATDFEIRSDGAVISFQPTALVSNGSSQVIRFNNCTRGRITLPAVHFDTPYTGWNGVAVTNSTSLRFIGGAVSNLHYASSSFVPPWAGWSTDIASTDIWFLGVEAEFCRFGISFSGPRTKVWGCKVRGDWYSTQAANYRTGTTGVATAASTTFTDASGPFIVADVGKFIRIPGGAGSGVAHLTTIASRTNATTVVLTVAPIVSVASGPYEVWTPWVGGSTGTEYYDGILANFGAYDFDISNNAINGVGQSGIYTDAVSSGTISNNNIRDVVNRSIDVGPINGGVCTGLSVTGNHCTDGFTGNLNLVGVNNSMASDNVCLYTPAKGIDHAGFAMNSGMASVSGVFTNGSGVFTVALGALPFPQVALLWIGTYASGIPGSLSTPALITNVTIAGSTATVTTAIASNASSTVTVGLAAPCHDIGVVANSVTQIATATLPCFFATATTTLGGGNFPSGPAYGLTLVANAPSGPIHYSIPTVVAFSGIALNNQIIGTADTPLLQSMSIGKLVRPRTGQSRTTDGSITFDMSLGNQSLFLNGGSCTGSAFINGVIDEDVEVEVTYSALGLTMAWPSICVFAGGAPPPDCDASGRNTVRFRFDGTNWFERSRATRVGSLIRTTVTDDAIKAIAAASTAQTLDRSQYAAYRLVASSASCAITLSGNVAGHAAKWEMFLVQNAGSQAFTFTNTILWAAATPYTASTAAGAKDRVVVTWDGVSFYGRFLKGFA